MASDDQTEETLLGGWTGWFLRNYATIQILLTINTALLWWLGSTEAVNNSLTYIFNNFKETFSSLEDIKPDFRKNYQ